MQSEEVVGIRYQATTGEDIADWEGLECVVMSCKLYKSVKLLELIVVSIYKCPINPITNRNLVSNL
jgi:hypothetical protein